MSVAIAVQVPHVRDPHLGRTRKPWGFLLHTTGGGVTDLAKRTSRRPIDVAIETYIASQNGSNGYTWGGPHYVIDLDGQIYQLAPDEILLAHAGGPNRGRYMDGSWETACPAACVSQWHLKWSPRRHPYQLFPSTSPNTDYVGCEMIPIGDGFGGHPRANGERFTDAQYDSAIALGHDIALRNAFPTGWELTSRLVGHEDVDPLERSDAGGGWDPGYLRARPYFDLSVVRRGIMAL